MRNSVAHRLASVFYFDIVTSTYFDVQKYNVYKDSIDGPLWLFVRKTGHTLQKKEPIVALMGGDDTILVVENLRSQLLHWLGRAINSITQRMQAAMMERLARTVFASRAIVSSSLTRPRALLLVAEVPEKARLWVQFQNSEPVIIDPGNARIVSDFLKIVKTELSPSTDPYGVSELILVKPDGDRAFGKDDIESLSSIDSYEAPLSLASVEKTIFIRDVTVELRPLQTFTQATVDCDADIEKILENKGSALINVTEPTKRVTKFKQLVDGDKYYIYSRYEVAMLDEVRWQQREDQAMEVEVARALKAFLLRELGESVMSLPTDLALPGGIVAQEWEAIFRVGDTIYLCEAKHVMSFEKLKAFPSRIEKFYELTSLLPGEYSSGVKRVVGVACGTWFPPPVQEEAKRLGLICVYPSGMRYSVEERPLSEFIMQ